MNGFSCRLTLSHTADQCGRPCRAVSAREYSRTTRRQGFRYGNISALIKLNFILIFKNALINALSDRANDVRARNDKFRSRNFNQLRTSVRLALTLFQLDAFKTDNLAVLNNEALLSSEKMPSSLAA